MFTELWVKKNHPMILQILFGGNFHLGLLYQTCGTGLCLMEL